MVYWRICSHMSCPMARITDCLFFGSANRYHMFCMSFETSPTSLTTLSWQIQNRGWCSWYLENVTRGDTETFSMWRNTVKNSHQCTSHTCSKVFGVMWPEELQSSPLWEGKGGRQVRERGRSILPKPKVGNDGVWNPKKLYLLKNLSGISSSIGYKKIKCF